MLTEKKNTPPKSWELRFILLTKLRTSAQDTASQVALRDSSEEAGWSQDIRVFVQQRPGSWDLISLLVIKENQTSQVREFSAFLSIGSFKSPGWLVLFLGPAPQLSRASVLYFLILSFFRVYSQGDGCSDWLLLVGIQFPAWVSSGLTVGVALMQWFDGCNVLCLLIRQAMLFIHRVKELFSGDCVCVCVRARVRVKLLQSCRNFCYPMHCNPPGSSVLEILQARLPSGSPVVDPGDLPNPATEPAFLMSSALAGRFFTTTATWEAPFSGVIKHFQLISMSQENGRALPIPTSKLSCVRFFSEKTSEVCSSFSLGFLCPFFPPLGLACPFLEPWLWYLPLPIPSTPGPQHRGFFLVTVTYTLICFLSVLSKAMHVHVMIEYCLLGSYWSARDSWILELEREIRQNFCPQGAPVNVEDASKDIYHKMSQAVSQVYIRC